MIRQFSLELVLTYMGHVQANAAEQVWRAIGRLDDRRWPKAMDNGSTIEVGVSSNRNHRGAKIDFSVISDQTDCAFDQSLRTSRSKSSRGTALA